jgi:hypothetical protein
MADPTTPRVRVGFTVTRADTGRWHVRCECLDNPCDVKALAPVLRSGRFGFDGREGVSPEQAAELARLRREALSHLTHTALSGRGSRRAEGLGPVRGRKGCAGAVHQC